LKGLDPLNFKVYFKTSKLKVQLYDKSLQKRPPRMNLSHQLGGDKKIITKKSNHTLKYVKMQYLE